jgi:uncharacterized protein with NRDE domain
MCLLVAQFDPRDAVPLRIAANRDEWLARPAAPLGELRPGVWGGRDLQAGGTWLAVNEHGVVAGLTNRPFDRAAGKRSRGELPLFLTSHATAAEAAAAFAREVVPSEYNGCWLLCGDRRTLHVIELSTRVTMRALGPGIHVLENAPYGPSPKADRVRALFAAGVPAREVLRSHETGGPPAEAACVHAGPYGTRCAEIILVPAAGRPRLWFADGPPCTTALEEVHCAP